MSTEVLKDAFIEVGGEDLSCHAASITLTNMKEILEATVLCDDAKRRISGLADSSVEIELRQDFEITGPLPDALAGFLFNNLGVPVLVRIRKSTDAVSPSNPMYTFTGIYGSLPLIQGGVGEIHNTSITIENSDGALLVRTTA